MAILRHSGSNYSMENNVTSQISGSFTSDCENYGARLLGQEKGQMMGQG